MGRKYRRKGSPKYQRKIRVTVKPTTYRRKGKLIHRKGYTYLREDLGKPGKGPKLIVIKERGALRKHGYSIKKSAAARHRALEKAIKEYGALSVFRKLKAMETLRKNIPKFRKAKKIFSEDAEYIREKYKVDGFVS